MRLLALSDLHREVWYRPQTWYEGKSDPFPTFDLAYSRPDAVLLAGDIDVGTRAVAWAQEAFAGLPVIYVHGNHEAYGGDVYRLHAELTAAASASANVHFLQRRALVLDDVRVLGASLWTDFNVHGSDRYGAALQDAARYMNDYRRIRVADEADRLLTPEDTARWHGEDLAWLKARLLEPFPGKTVVITHMAPSLRSVPEQFRGSPLSAAFASDLEDLVARVDVWIHGHTHSSADYRIGDARVVVNPLGYPLREDVPENPDFNPNLIVVV